MQTLQNHKIGEMRAGRRSENRLDGMTVKSTGDGKRVNEGISIYLLPGLTANSLGSGLSGRSSSQRMLTTHQRLPS